MCVCVCVLHAFVCVLTVCSPANANRYHYPPSASLELNVRAITCVCDSPLSQVLSLCSHMQPARQESTECNKKKHHTNTLGLLIHGKRIWHSRTLMCVPTAQIHLTYHR